jgi:hypothetical protein
MDDGGARTRGMVRKDAPQAPFRCALQRSESLPQGDEPLRRTDDGAGHDPCTRAAAHVDLILLLLGAMAWTYRVLLFADFGPRYRCQVEAMVPKGAQTIDLDMRPVDRRM